MIDQKAREIAVDAMWVPSWADGEAKDVIRSIYMSGERDDEHSVKAARLGIIEGLEMAAKWHDEQAEKEEFAPRLFHQKSAAAIRSLK